MGRVRDTEGPTWFVPGALPGELVEAEREHEAKRFVRGRLVRVVQPSRVRVAAPCEHAATCGGCAWQHVEAAAQASFKRDIAADGLRKWVPSERVKLAFQGAPLGYRRRVRMHYRRTAEGFTLGFLAGRSHAIVDVPRCPVLVPVLDRAVQRMRGLADGLPEHGEVLGLTDGQRVVLGLPGLRAEPALLDRLATLVDDELVGLEIRGGRQAARVGRPFLDLDAAPGVPPMRATPFVFTQAQAEGAHALLRHVVRAARVDGLRVLELFAGAGNFTRALARTASRVWASEIDREAVELVRGMARVHELPINAKRQSVSGLLPKLAQRGVTYDVVVLDPPRAGLGEAEMRSLCRVAEARIVYVSCDPSTLARDLAIAVANGFTVRDVAVFDLMPMTPEIEVVATLDRGAPR